MKTLHSLALITLTGVLFGASSTFAGDTQPQSINVRTKVVTFYDLDLAQPKDAQTLLNRIQSAVKKVCREASDHGADVHAGIDRNRCLESSYRETMAKVDARFNIKIEEIAALAGGSRELVTKR